MSDILGYQDKKVVITGAASGMGAAAAQLLVDLGAEVYALDIAPVVVGVAKAITADMQDQASLDAAVAELPGQVDALFNCAGVPSPPCPGPDCIMINFAGLRYLTECLLPRIPEGGAIASIASTAGMGWKPHRRAVREFLALENPLASAAEWIAANADKCADGYGFSKQCIILYTMSRAAQLAERNIRINCMAPSPTVSGFMDRLKSEGQMPDELIDSFLPPNGRYAEAADMGQPLVLLNSRLMSFVSGVNLPVDFGYCAQVTMGQRDDLLGIAG